MKWCRISTGIESVQVAKDEIVYIRADGNYSDFVLTNGKVEHRAIGRINDQLYFIATRHRKPSGTLPMPSANTASLMPSTSQVVPIMSSTAIRVVSNMTLVILLIIHMRNGRG